MKPASPDTIEALFRGAGLTVESARPIDHAVQFRLRDGGAVATVNLYHSGRVLVQGPEAALNARIGGLLAPHVVPGKKEKKEMPGRRPCPPPGGSPPGPGDLPADPPALSASALPAEPRIGTDESGKGDYFGPLVVAAAFVRPQDEAWLAEIGVRDCKLLDDRTVVRLAVQLRKALPCEVVVFPPPKYNALYPKFGNLNTLLAWGHARALEKLIERTGAAHALTDRFADPAVLERQLGERGRAIRLVQRVRAESDPAVAAASVLARGEFLRRLGLLSKSAGLTLPPGAGPQVEAAARRLAAEGGAEALFPFAKMHFKTTGKVLPT